MPRSSNSLASAGETEHPRLRADVHAPSPHAKSVRFSPHGTVNNAPVKNLLSRALRPRKPDTANSLASACEPAAQTNRYVRRRRHTTVPERFRDGAQLPVRRQRGNFRTDSSPTQPRSVSGTEFPIDRIISCHVNTDRNHPAAALNEPVYRVRWTGFDQQHDTYEPVEHLPRNKIVSFHRNNGTTLLHNLNEAAAE